MTTATITVEIEVIIKGDHCRAEPDVGIMNSYYEVEGFCHKAIDWPTIEEQYSEEIQEALAEADQAESDDAADRKYDEMKDRQGEDK
jgi:hypothetical protein